MTTGAVIVAGKHESMFEAIDLPALLRLPVPFAKAELLRIPLWGRVGRLYGVVPVERDACGGCYNSIPPQRQSEIRQRKKIIVCENCGRILADKELFDSVEIK